MTILVVEATIDGEDLIEGDYIGVFNSDGICSGYSPVVEGGMEEDVGIAAMGAEENDNNGFADGEDIEFRFWDTSAGREYVAAFQMVAGEAVWHNNNFSVARLSAGDEFEPADEAVIEPGASVDVLVWFDPEAPGDHAGTLTITSDDPDNGEVEVRLVGVGEAVEPEIRVSADDHNFGEVLIDDSDDWTFTIYNDGNGDLEVESVVTTGDYFSDDLDAGFTIEPEGEQNVVVTFAPGEAGDFEGVVTIVSNDPNQGELVVSVSGMGVAEAVPAIGVPEEIDFGLIEVGQNGEETLTIENTGDAALTVSNIEAAGDGFSVDWDNDIAEFDWEFDITDQNMTILVVEATIDGEDLIEGDYIGVFNSDGICSGYSPVVEGGMEEDVGIAAMGAEENDNNGFADGEDIEFRFWDTSAGREYVAAFQMVAGEAVWHNNNFSVARLSAGGEFDPGDLAEEVIEPEGILEVTVYFEPGQAGDFNGVITIISNAEENEMRVALAGEGVRAAGHWDPIDTGVSESVLIRSYSIDGDDLSQGDEIGVFTTDGVVAGVGVAEGDGEPIGLAAFANNPDNEEIDGFRRGEIMSFKIWDGSTDTEYDATSYDLENMFGGEGSLEFEIDGFVSLDLVAEMNTLSVDVDAVEFGDVGVGLSAEATVTITNEGIGSIAITEVIPTNVDNFEVDFEEEFELAADASHEFTVTFNPDAVGDFNSNLEIHSTAPNQGAAIVRLHGVG
ncbi:MAG: choice-of-anchor D domain-containing protein [Candidatus Cloacimonetes bacterium]|nr:choice-of-anchor D domain-containing protein [Candidatus Cloacimonadota bacterium]